MTPFLHKVAKIFYEKYGNELYRHTFVLPNRRAGLFLQKYIAEIAGRPLFSPAMLTIQELFASLSSYQLADRIEMLVMLYNHYRKISGSGESFDDFLFWGDMLLNDFDDADKCLVDAKQLFRNVHDFRSLDDDLTHLTEDQITAIRRFWTHFMPVEGSEAKQKFQETWKILYELYIAFRSELQKKGRAYEGMMFREVAEKAKAKEGRGWRTESFVFVGLNALTPAENMLLEYLRDIGMADFYWDYDSPAVLDPQNKASFRVADNITRFPSKFRLPAGDVQDEKTVVELIGVPSAVGQAKQVTRILSRLIESGAIPDPGEAINTAIVLPDENLLLPVLYSIPQEIGKINVTMGYGLSHSSVASLVEHIALLQQNLRTRNGETAYYHRYVKALLNHPLVKMAADGEAESLKEHILAFNRIVVSQSEIPDHPLLTLIFTPIARWQEIGDYLHQIFSHLYQSLPVMKRKGQSSDMTDAEMNDREPVGMRAVDLEQEFIVQYYKTVTRLQDRLSGAGNMTVETWFGLLKKLARSISVSFSGEPLTGLQVMGVLETRSIDFENLIILSMNEGVFPVKNASGSFIPHTLRKGFGLPTHEHQDSTYAYHFYRMIGRAKRVYMLYDTRTEDVQSGEVSRYFYQLKYLYNPLFDISERVVAYDVTAPENLPVTVTKTPEVMCKLDDFRAGNEKFLSASLINNYIDCPLKFYFTAVEGLSEENEVQESVEADVFGSIFHRLMEIIYNRYKSRTVTPDLLTGITKDETYLTKMLEQAFARYYFRDEKNPQPLEGQHYLIGEVLRSYVKQTLLADRQFTPFQYIGSEYRFCTVYPVTEGLTLNFKGSIDRIDRVGETLRIVDYKTGSGPTSFKEMAQLFDSSKNNRPYQILQVFVYGLFYLMGNPGTRVSPAVYYLRSVFKDFDPSICHDKHPIDDISVYMEEFSEMFRSLLKEIFDPAVPFSQTQNPKNCEWCAFKDLCNR
ncbi:MAG: PD-(D/E)XK nuclease family protein [Proteiniphilum sp.]